MIRIFAEPSNKDLYRFKHEINGRLATDSILIDRKGTYWVWSCKSHRYSKYKRLSDALKDIDKEVNCEIH